MERIGKEVERSLSRIDHGRALALSEITAAWPTAVGDAIARQAWPLRLGRDGTLHVATTSATWAFELDRLSAEISARLAAALGKTAPERLRFRVGPVPEPGPPAEAVPEHARAALPTSPEVESEVASLTAPIEDSELRTLVARAARASLLRASSGRRFW